MDIFVNISAAFKATTVKFGEQIDIETVYHWISFGVHVYILTGLRKVNRCFIGWDESCTPRYLAL